MKIYQLPNSHSCGKVLIVLHEKGLNFEAPGFEMKYLKSDEFLRFSPSGKVPCLVDGNLAISESEVIVEYLEEKFPSKPVLPAGIEDRAKARFLSRLHDFNVSPVVAGLFVPLLDGRISQTKLNDHAGQEQMKKLHAELAKIEAIVTPSPYLAGKTFSVADAAFALTVWYAEHCGNQYGDPFEAKRYPKLAQWFAKVQLRPSVATVISGCRAANGLKNLNSKAA